MNKKNYLNMLLSLVFFVTGTAFAASNSNVSPEEKEKIKSLLDTLKKLEKEHDAQHFYDEFLIHDRANCIEMMTPEGYEFDYVATINALRGIGTGPFYRKIENTEEKK